MDRTPIEYQPINRWRVILQGTAKLALYLCCLAVIAGPTLLMIVAAKPDDSEVRCVKTRKMT